MTPSALLGGGAVLAADLVVLLLVIGRPMFLDQGDDQGDGLSQVAIAESRAVNPLRTLWFFVLLVGLSVAVVGLQGPMQLVYRRAVGALASMALERPTVVAAYTAHLHTSARFLVASYFLALALSLRTSPARRVMIAWHALLYLILTVTIDTTVLYLAEATGLPLRSYALESTFIVIASGVLVMIRLIFTTFELPRPTALGVSRVRQTSDSMVLSMVILTILALVGVAFALAAQRTVTTTLLPELLALTIGSVSVLLIYFVLIVVGSRYPVPRDPDTWPDLDVVVPAYNEATRLGPVLDSLERAARRYRGRVRILVSDDGSTDETAAVAAAAMARFEAAHGELIRNPHVGKARALNIAIFRTEAEIVVRFDADNLVHDGALAQLPKWFADPTVGTVGGTSIPHPYDGSFFHRMRLFEIALGFRFARLGLMVVDGITCIPGSFAAFRRDPVVSFGGVAEGMNGEDADVTMQLGRMGYRAVIDPGIIIYDNVPFTLPAFRKQRIRWSRGSVHVFARHSPLRAGLAGPRTWFTLVRTVAINFTSVVRPILLIHGIVLVILAPTLLRSPEFVLVLFLLSASPMLGVAALIVIRERWWRALPWLVFWYPFAFLRRVFVLEALMSLPTRPVRVRDWVPSFRLGPWQSLRRPGPDL